MKSELIIASLLLCVLNISAFGQLDKLTSYEEFDLLSRKYVQTNNFDSAIIVIESARGKYPEYDKDATYLLDSLFLRTKQDLNVLKNIDYGLKKRYFFGLERYDYKDLINYPEFIRLAKIDWQIEDSLNKLSHMKYEIVLPTNYSADKKYPILFVFHGNSRNIQKEKGIWTSDMTKDKFIMAYVQSYIYLTPHDYRWEDNDEKTNKEFAKIYEQILSKYPVGKNKVIFSAMSAGGSIAITYAFSQFVPVDGLVLNCPVVPDISDNLIRKFVDENKKIGIITGEKDFVLNDQKELINKVDKIGGNSMITINAGLGHEYANNFSTLLDRYLIWILE